MWWVAFNQMNAGIDHLYASISHLHVLWDVTTWRVFTGMDYVSKLTSVPRHFMMSYCVLLKLCILTQKPLIYTLKTIPLGVKDTKDSNLTIFSCYVNVFCPGEMPGSNETKHLALPLGLLPCRMLIHLDSLFPISLWPLAFPPLTLASCMPRSFFIGKKREMYEHPVFCLASQVMDLTIREYLHHPVSLSSSFTSIHSFCLSSFFLQRCCYCHACFSSCGFCLWEWVGSVPVERSEQHHTETVGEGVLF